MNLLSLILESQELELIFMNVLFFFQFECVPRNFAIKLDGATKDTITTGGPIGMAAKELPDKILKGVVPIIVFVQIKTNVDKTVDYSLFNGREDIMAMVDFCIGIDTGVIPQKYHHKKPPIINNSRYFIFLYFNKIFFLMKY